MPLHWLQVLCQGRRVHGFRGMEHTLRWRRPGSLDEARQASREECACCYALPACTEEAHLKTSEHACDVSTSMVQRGLLWKQKDEKDGDASRKRTQRWAHEPALSSSAHCLAPPFTALWRLLRLMQSVRALLPTILLLLSKMLAREERSTWAGFGVEGRELRV